MSDTTVGGVGTSDNTAGTGYIGEIGRDDDFVYRLSKYAWPYSGCGLTTATITTGGTGNMPSCDEKKEEAKYRVWVLMRILDLRTDESQTFEIVAKDEATAERIAIMRSGFGEDDMEYLYTVMEIIDDKVPAKIEA